MTVSTKTSEFDHTSFSAESKIVTGEKECPNSEQNLSGIPMVHRLSWYNAKFPL